MLHHGKEDVNILAEEILARFVRLSNRPSRKFHLTPKAVEMDGLGREEDRETRSKRRLAVTHSVGRRSRVLYGQSGRWGKSS